MTQLDKSRGKSTLCNYKTLVTKSRYNDLDRITIYNYICHLDCVVIEGQRRTYTDRMADQRLHERRQFTKI